MHEHEKWIGVKIYTTQQAIQVLINDFQSCCERYDVLLLLPTGEEREMIGAVVQRVGWGRSITPANMDKIRMYHSESDFKSPDIDMAIVDIETDRGLIQAIAYNVHNGYYPHRVHVTWNGYSDTQTI